MAKCSNNEAERAEVVDTCSPACSPESPPKKKRQNEPSAWFGRMIQNCYRYASEAKANGRRIVGIMCEYTPRELIMAADAVPVCLCGGSAEMIPPAEEHLPANLCPLIKSTYGYHIRKANPFLEMADLVVAETTCDGKKKMYELMDETRPMYVLELPQKQDDEDAMAHWVIELRKLKTKLEGCFRVTISDQKLRQAVATMNKERALRRELAELMKADTPPLTGRQLLDFKSSISGIDADFEQYARAAELYRSRSGRSKPNGEVRVLMTGVPIVHGAERVLDIIESHGGLVVCMDNCTGLKPIIEDVDETTKDPILALAEKYFRLPCSVMTKNDRRLDMLRKMAAEYRPHCIIELIWQACITYDVESYRIRQLAEKELGIPYLRIETDYSPSDSARIALRVEALLEAVRHRAGKQECRK
ncbi:MAG: double-cubane-cluster-containing anaerobic reductase [Planctomycetota bacterium]|jgi:benzoyl-CoA reductase/2-hydroxyglutaryl-CoA dehydratase subunit BcrC/BadD/HgdB